MFGDVEVGQAPGADGGGGDSGTDRNPHGSEPEENNLSETDPSDTDPSETNPRESNPNNSGDNDSALGEGLRASLVSDASDEEVSFRDSVRAGKRHVGAAGLSSPQHPQNRAAVPQPSGLPPQPSAPLISFASTTSLIGGLRDFPPSYSTVLETELGQAR